MVRTEYGEKCKSQNIQAEFSNFQELFFVNFGYFQREVIQLYVGQAGVQVSLIKISSFINDFIFSILRLQVLAGSCIVWSMVSTMMEQCVRTLTWTMIRIRSLAVASVIHRSL